MPAAFDEMNGFAAAPGGPARHPYGGISEWIASQPIAALHRKCTDAEGVFLMSNGRGVRRYSSMLPAIANVGMTMVPRGPMISLNSSMNPRGPMFRPRRPPAS